MSKNLYTIFISLWNGNKLISKGEISYSNFLYKPIYNLALGKRQIKLCQSYFEQLDTNFDFMAVYEIALTDLNTNKVKDVIYVNKGDKKK